MQGVYCTIFVRGDVGIAPYEVLSVGSCRGGQSRPPLQLPTASPYTREILRQLSHPRQIKRRGVLRSGGGALLGEAVQNAAVLHVRHGGAVLRAGHVAGQ